MSDASSAAVFFRLTVAFDMLGAVLTGALIVFLRWQRRRAYMGQSALQALVILRIYEPVLWMLGLAFVVQSLLLSIPGPLPTVPVWFSRALYRRTEAPKLIWSDSGVYWLYTFTFECMAEGFGIMLLHKIPSLAAFASTLRYAALYAAVAASVTTLGYNWESLGLAQATQLSLDVVFLAVPCVLYVGLLLQFTLLTKRRSLLSYAAYCVVWRTALILSISISASTFLATAIISALRTFAAPFVMYWTLARDTRYWNEVVGEADPVPPALPALDKAAAHAGSGMLKEGGLDVAVATEQPRRSLDSSSSKAARAASSGPVVALSWLLRLLPYRTRNGESLSGQQHTPLLSHILPEATSSVSQGDARAPYGTISSSDDLRRAPAPAPAPRLASFLPPAAPLPPELPLRQGGGGPVLPLSGFIPHSEVNDTFKQLGRGGMALVTLGKWRGKDVALKKSLPEDLHRQDAVDAMMREGAVYRALSACPHIVRFYGLVRSPPHMYMVLELCRGGSLYSALGDDIEAMQKAGDYSEARRTLRWADKLRIARDIASALAYMHGLGLAHMDVKTANVLLKPPPPPSQPPQQQHLKKSLFAARGSPRPSPASGEAPPGANHWAAVLADFGEYVDVGRAGEPQRRRRLEQPRGGTAHYKSPERLLPRRYVDASADVYAFGVLLWELITYRYPYYEQQLECRSDAEFERWLQREVPAGRRPTDESDAPWLAEAPRGLPELMEQCWATRPRDRPAMPEVVEDLSAILGAWLGGGEGGGKGA